MKSKIYILILLAIGFNMTSCVKEIIEDEPFTIDNIPTQEIITSSFYGQVRDMEGNAITTAEILLLNETGGIVKRETDESGNFQFLDMEVKGNYGNVKVIAAGMWEVNKTVLLIKNKTSRVDIVCQEKGITKFFSNSTGGVINVSNDIEVNFAPTSIVTIDGLSYDGKVNVSARSIVKGQDNFRQMTYGNAWGLDKGNNITRVEPLVTLDLELSDESGNPLQIKEGEKAIVKMKLPQNIDENLLETGMLHFNTSFFAWDENVTFSINNGFIETEVSHFSTWSWCQILNLRTKIFGQLERFGFQEPINALHYVIVEYEPISFYVPTATDGSFYMPFALGDLPFTLKVLNECEEEIYLEEFPAIDVGIEYDLGTIQIITNAIHHSTLTVDVINCDSTWVENGYAVISFDGLDFQRREVIPIENGSFEYAFMNCESDLIGTLFILDEENLMTTDPIEVNLNNGDVHLSDVILCDTFASFMEIIVEGNQLMRSHSLTHGCTSSGGGMGEQITGINDLAIFQTDGFWDGPGEHVVNVGSFIDIENDLLYKVNSNVTFTITEFQPNDDNNECYRPGILIGTFEGKAEEFDNTTNVFIREVDISGTFEYL